MFSLITESVRCLHARQCTPIAPLTLLVGENSSGKSTFLALYRAAWDMLFGESPDFNEEPFLLGSFDDIATHLGGTARAKQFHLGYELDLETSDKRKIDNSLPQQMQIIASFESQEGQPTITSWSIVCGPYELLGRGDDSADNLRAGFEIRTPTGTVEIDLDRLGPHTLSTLIRNWPWISFHIVRSKDAELAGFRIKGAKLEENQLNLIEVLMSVIHNAHRYGRPYALAPIRMKPKRTYDPVKDTPRPEGGHVPMVLAKAKGAAGRGKKWQHLRDPLNEFGRQSKLFGEIDVKRLGRKGSGPFQISVKIAGIARNLLDVGYGVGQVLPILVDSLSREKTTILLQQPEVHLHPCAQAQIGTFLAELVKEQQMRFVVETHSDHLLDRIRMDIRDKRTLDHDQVLILYFERNGAESTIHPLTLDEYGNIKGAPQSYREFFLREEKRHLLG